MQIAIGVGFGMGGRPNAGSVTVGATSQVTMAPSSLSLSADHPTGPVFAVARDAALHPTGVPVTYTSSNTSVATVHPTSGLVTQVGLGTANVTASAGGFTSSACVVSVVAGATTQIVLSPSTATLAGGGTTTLTATAEDSLGRATGDAVAFNSSNTSVATVNGAGLVTAVAAGSTTVTARVGAVVSNGCAVTVSSTAASGYFGEFFGHFFGRYFGRRVP